uniref:L1 transposable element RRM domain-containing protein n=1 Tax=Latimeria chalumnae TaxID=7897 RepID=H3AVT7_LATCH
PSPTRTSTSKMASDTPCLETTSGPATSAEISNLMNLMQGMAADVASIKMDVADIRGNLETLGQRVTSVETKTGRLGGRMDDHEARLAKVEDDLAHQTRYAGELWDRVQDLESRSRRNNIRVIGIPEGVEGSGLSGPTLLLTVLRECLSLGEMESIEVERAHCTLGPRPPLDQRPRPIIARLLRFQDRERILRLAREAGELHWRGGKIMIFPDMSQELAAQRKLFTPARRRCMELGIRYALQYPAVLRVTVNGRQLKFEDPEEAIRELNRIPDQNRREEDPQPQRK